MCSEELKEKRKANKISNARLFSRIMIACRCIFFVPAVAVYAAYLSWNSDREFNFADYSIWTFSCIAGLISVFFIQFIMLICLLAKLMNCCGIYKESCLATFLYWLSTCLSVIFWKFLIDTKLCAGLPTKIG